MRPILFILLLLIGGTAQLLPAAVDHEIALVTRVQGMVTIRYHETGNEALVSRGYLLMDRSIIRTGTRGMVQIRFIGSGTTVLIRPESECMFTMNIAGDASSEGVRLNAGQAIFDVRAFYKGSFDIATPAAMMTAEECVALVTFDRLSGNSALFLSSGTCRIADPGFSAWTPIHPPTAVYVTAGSPFLYTSKLAAKDNAHLDEFVKSVRSMKNVGPLTHALILESDSGGRVLPGNYMTALQGYAIDLVAKPMSGFAFIGWEVLNGAAIITNPAAESTTVSIASDATVTARFTNSPTRLVIHAQGPGKTVPEGVAVIPRKYLWKVSALPFFGYALKKWHASKGIKLMSQDSVSATVITDTPVGEVTAEFVLRKFTCAINRTKGGTIKPDGLQHFMVGDSITVNAAPAGGYTFTGWNIGKGRARILNPRALSTAILCDSSNVEITAQFSKTSKTSFTTINQHERAHITPSGTIAVPLGETFVVTAAPQTGYEVERWIVRLGEAEIKGTEHAVVRPQSTCELVPVVVTKKYNLTVTASGPGTAIPAMPSRVFHGMPFTIAATPEAGKQFALWQIMGGNAVIADKLSPQTTIALTSTDAVVAAEFATALGKVTVDAAAGGYTEPSGTQIMYEGKVMGIKAIPNPRAAFLGWALEPGEKILDFSDTVSAREQIVTMRRAGAARITARFSTETVELSVISNGLGATEPSKALWVPQDQWIPLKATPVEGNSFVQWVVVSGTHVEIRDKFSAETEINAGTGSATIKALFTSPGQTASFEQESAGGPLALAVTADVNQGAVEPSGTLSIEPGMPVTFTATAAPQYYFLEWVVTEGNAIISDRYNRITNVTLLQRNTRIEARFALRVIQTIEAGFVDPTGQRKSIIIEYR